MAIITTAHVKAYNSSVVHLAQQKFSKLRNTVLNDTLVGEEGYYDQLGPTELDAVSSRHGDTPITNADHQRRRVTSNPFAKARLCDTFDKARVLIEPDGNYAMSQAMGVARKTDQLILDAFDAVAYTDKTGSTSTSPLAANEIAVGTTDLSLEKMTEAMQILLDNGVDPNVEELHAAITSRQLRSLLELTQVGSADYNTVKALVAGEVDTFMGFKFHVFGRTAGRNATLAISGNNRSTFFYAKTGMLLATAEEPVTTIDRRPDKLNSIQVLTKMDMGATRLEEEKVVHVLCDESA